MAEVDGGRFHFTYWGSRNIIGIANKEGVKNPLDEDGINFVVAMNKSGLDFKKQDTRKDKRHL